jgi:hypothetical protein
LFIKIKPHKNYTRLRFGGRQPLCGSGVTSSIDDIRKPACCSAATADSLPGPGPFTFTSISRTPFRIAVPAARDAACDAANGVLLRAPLKPTQPAELVQIVSPAVSVIVIRVLLKVAFIWTTPFATFFLTLRFAATFAIVQNLMHQIMKTNYPRISFTPFFPATVFLGPLRVLALVRVRWP